MVSATDSIVQDIDSSSDSDVGDESIFIDVSFVMPFFHPSKLPFKLVILFFVCFLNFGPYFCYDNPSALQDQIIADMDVTFADYTVLYSVYSWPNVVQAILGGFLVDTIFGIRAGAIIFGMVVFAGQIVFALGGFMGQFWLMIFGRFIFGLGGENLTVCRNLYAAKWFKGTMLNMAFGIQLSVARLGSSTNLWVMEPIYQMVHSNASGSPAYVSLGVTLFIGAIVCLFSLLCATVLLFLDRYGKHVLNCKERETKGTCTDLKRIVEVRQFPAEFWFTCLICVFYYVTIFPFVSVAQTFFIMKYHLDADTANLVNSFVFLVSLFASPVFGFAIDRTGRNILWIMAGCILATVAHGLLAFAIVNPYICTVLMGVSFAITASSLWPLVAYALPTKNLGTGYGVMQAIQNLGLAIMPLIAGVIVDAKGYLILGIIFVLCLFMALSCALVLWIVDSGRGGKLNLTASARKRLIDREGKEK